MEGTSASASSSMPYQNMRKRKRSTPSNTWYQVFINHRGPDVKKTLASIIYRCLQSKGVEVFLDKDEFQPGQPLKSTIEEAIRASSVHVAIFSKRYAESHWCLDELCLMLETGAPIIPVFYKVSPSDLRWIEKGKYASAFAQHEEKGRVDSETISHWKLALKTVSGISGLDLGQGDWGQFLDSLEDAVFRSLKPAPLEVATDPDPVGLDEIIADFESFMKSGQQCENKEVKIVGIVGFGGSGKTTLAKEFFNRESPSFDRSSFLFDLRDASSRNALPNLQRKLLQDLRIEDCKIDNVIEGKRIIKERLQSLLPRVLIVLDDINHPSQVNDLLVRDVLKAGSLIIITSRDEEPLRDLEASVYKIKALSSQHAQDLFCKRAFQQPYLKAGFEDLVEKFCGKCGGLPLFLKVMGAHLRVNCSNDRNLWEEELKYIPKDILSILDVSYNALSKEEKQIFLDIACFFHGEKKELGIEVWDECEGRGSLRLKILTNKCLVEFDSNNCFKMHDHLRDFGRQIANQEIPCRLWNESQAANFRGERKATKEFRGIVSATVQYPFHEFNDRKAQIYWMRIDKDFRRLLSEIYHCPLHGTAPLWQSSYRPPFEGIELSALKILSICGDYFDEQIGRRLKNLVWLRWVECPHTDISSWLISMKNLTVLELYGQEIEKWPLLRKQARLRYLKIVGTNLRMISNFEDVCPCVDRLDLRLNRKLIEIKQLPHKLVKLNLTGCAKLREVQGLEHLSHLQKLNISGCSALTEMPNLQQFPSLGVLNASYCSNLQHIRGVEHLRQLRRLSLDDCSELRELPKLRHMAFLETLDVRSCVKLQRIQGLEDLPQLRRLDIYNCCELGELPKLQQLPSLEDIRVNKCAKLQHIQVLEHLPQLRRLTILQCFELRELPKLQRLRSLEAISLSDCDSLERIQGLEDLPQLQQLKIVYGDELQEFPNVAQLISLEEVEARGCGKLQGIQGLDQLQKLKSLKLSVDDSRAIWNSIKHMKRLRTSMRLSARAEVNSLDNPDLLVVDLDIHEKEGLWKLVGWAERENVGTCFMVYFVVHFPTGHSRRELPTRMYDDGNHSVKRWGRSVEEGEWVYALLSSSEGNSMKHLGAQMVMDCIEKYQRDREGTYKVKRGWMASGSEAMILEAAKRLFAP